MALVAGAAVIAVMLLWPGSGSRALVAVEDAVHGERPILAGAALALGWDHWIAGLGTAFAETLGAWYLPVDLEHRFRTALNDYLTLAGQNGAPVAAVVGGFVLSVLVSAWRSRHDRWIGPLVGLLVVHLICGLFQAHLWYFWTRLTFLTVLILLVARLLFIHRATIFTRRSIGRSSVTWAVCTMTLLSLHSAAGWLAAQRHPIATRIVAGHLVAGLRSSQWQADASQLIYVDTVRGGKRFRRGIGSCAIADGYSVGIVPTVDAAARMVGNLGDQSTRVAGLCGGQDVAVDLWKSLRSGTETIPGIIFDPTDVPGPRPPSQGPGDHAFLRTASVFVVATTHAPFVPPVADLQRAIVYDGPGSVVASFPKDRSDAMVWTQIKDFLRRRLPPISPQ